MRKLLLSTFALGLFALTVNPAQAQMEMAEGEAVNAEFTVVDLSCKVVYNLSGDDHRMCSQVCADNGIPLGLMSADGDLYIPVSTGMPGTGDNARLKEHAEMTIHVRGKVVKRGGINTIIIEEIAD